jgi:hypothetical protein
MTCWNVLQIALPPAILADSNRSGWNQKKEFGHRLWPKNAASLAEFRRAGGFICCDALGATIVTILKSPYCLVCALVLWCLNTYMHY